MLKYGTAGKLNIQFYIQTFLFLGYGFFFAASHFNKTSWILKSSLSLFDIIQITSKVYKGTMHFNIFSNRQLDIHGSMLHFHNWYFY